MRRFLVCGVALPILAFLLIPAAAQHAVCPKCGAPLEPGAEFCTGCGQRLDRPAPAAAPQRAVDPAASVVQVIATHDKELTTALGAIAFGMKIDVGSVVGSAFAIASGEFVTDFGLLSGAKGITLRTPNGRSVPATVKGLDPMIGVGLIVADLVDVPPLRLRLDDVPQLGTALTAYGFPSNLRSSGGASASSGVVSGLHRGSVGIHPIEDYIQTDASLTPGFAGGPAADGEGRVVGMSTAFLVGSQVSLGVSGIGRLIPSTWIQRSLAWMRAGSTPRPWIGVHAVTTDAELRKTYSLPGETKRMVELVFPGSPAEAAGLRRGDGLLNVHGLDPADPVAIHSRLLESRPGETWSCDVARRGERLTFRVTLTERPKQPRLGPLESLRFFGGLEVADRGGTRLVVTRVLPDSEAQQAGVKPGDVLHSALIKKDLEHAHRDNARWRGVNDLQTLERLLPSAYSDFDFFVGLRLKSSGGEKEELFLFEFLTPPSAL